MKGLKIQLAILGYWLLANANIAFAAGLVPCSGPDCTLCDFLAMGKNIIEFLLKLAVALGVVFIIWGGFNIMFAGGSTEKVTKGRKALLTAVVGVAIALGAWLIVGTIFNILGGSSPLPWNQIQCS